MKILMVFIMIVLFSSSYLVLAREFVAPYWSKGRSIYEVNVRQYTREGTFSAFREHLPRLQEMGVGILWLMPVNPIGDLNRKGSLGSYYSVSDYLKLNPEFGSETEFRELVQDIHARGMYIILDWVANHTSWDHVWTVSQPEYYKKDASGRFYPPVRDWSDVIQLDYRNRGLREEMIRAMKYWVEEFDIDGYRCDVAEMVPLDFWIDTRRELEEVKGVFMLAECENPAYHAAFDMTYAWSAYQLFKDIASGRKPVIELDGYRMRQMRLFEPEDMRMLFLTNHDENSWSGTMLKHFPESYKAYTVLTYALPGMPLVYSGQEALNDRQLKFFDKDIIEWQETDMNLLYKRLNQLKKDNAALQNSPWQTEVKKIANSHPYQVYSLLRKKGESEVLFLINLSGEAVYVKLSGIAGEYTDYVSGEDSQLQPDMTYHLEPYGYMIYEKN